ncbi:unnamed protein product, partial [Amoebophrya sp. A25]
EKVYSSSTSTLEVKEEALAQSTDKNQHDSYAPDVHTTTSLVGGDIYRRTSPRTETDEVG